MKKKCIEGVFRVLIYKRNLRNLHDKPASKHVVQSSKSRIRKQPIMICSVTWNILDFGFNELKFSVLYII